MNNGDVPLPRSQALHRFLATRRHTEELCAPLATDDFVVQTAVEVSPPKWHLAHVSWFFERFLLGEYLPGYRPFHPLYRQLFDSSCASEGGILQRSERGLLVRPSVAEVYRYRNYVDQRVGELIEGVDARRWAEVVQRLVVALNHEEQHQEQLLSDLKHLFGRNPLRPAYRDDLRWVAGPAAPLEWLEYPGGVVNIGHRGEGFAYDNEGPSHRAFLEPYRLASRLVTNGEYLEFMGRRGYERPELWLSDGWEVLRREGWRAPLYWERIEGRWYHYTLGGMRPVDEDAPVTHVSFYEAEAFAHWSDKRLPTEAEWEHAASGEAIDGNFQEQDAFQPMPAVEGGGQFFGDCWEWTRSAHAPYPGYRASAGAVGEYCGTFMCNQQVLRGGSCVTLRHHIRPTYRNYFPPHERWQFKGFRLAEQLS